MDAEDGTPVIDIKPYTPSFDRVESPIVPDWCASWPKDVETSGDFGWKHSISDWFSFFILGRETHIKLQ